MVPKMVPSETSNPKLAVCMGGDWGGDSENSPKPVDSLSHAKKTMAVNLKDEPTPIVTPEFSTQATPAEVVQIPSIKRVYEAADIGCLDHGWLSPSTGGPNGISYQTAFLAVPSW